MTHSDRPLDSFTANERAVIHERMTGWEQASAADLSLIFRTHPATIRAIVRAHRLPDPAAHTAAGHLPAGDAACVAGPGFFGRAVHSHCRSVTK